METVPYITYRELTKPFYTIDEMCQMFEADRIELRKYSEKYKVYPERNEIGQAGFSTYNLCRLHNFIYKELHPRNDDEIWNN